MERRTTAGPPPINFILFVALSFAILMAHAYLTADRDRRAGKPQQAARQQAPAEVDADGKKKPEAEPAPPEQPEEKPQPKEQEPPPPEEKPRIEGPEIVAPKPQSPEQWVTLGSADSDSPYRMLVTLTNRGAAVARIELNSPHYHDLDNRTGYLGHLVMDETIQGNGCPVQVVGPGTPAAKAGLKPGDLIKAVNGTKIAGAKGLRNALQKTKPGREVTLTVARGKKELQLSATLTRQPLQVVRPEENDALSFLLTLHQIDDRELPKEEKTTDLGKELDGLNLWHGTWNVVRADKDQVAFSRQLPKWGLEIIKTYRLASVPAEEAENADYKAYHLVFDVEIRNTGDRARKVAYQLDGPTGLPDEGAWYAYKVGRDWGAVGLRDVVVSFEGGTPSLIGCPAIAEGDVDPPWQDQSLTYIGVDAQYFSAVLIPQKENPAKIWFAQSHPLLVGKVDKEQLKTTNTSCRVTSTVHRLEPKAALTHRFEVFAGPKKPSLLDAYALQELVYYGWFSVIAVPMVKTLHFFYLIVGNYGLAIIMLTVVVRLCMYPMSKKQAQNAQKMQELQPEIKKLQEKYKKDLEARSKAQQELFRKHNCNPLSGCLVLFVQLPIFMALYRSLMVAIELRQAPLIWEGFRWCSNLSAPDMLFDWSGFMPGFVLHYLGPYFNVLPILTVVLFLWQQKMFMPPPADEQAAMQQKIMQYMMLFMGVLFFKVASGLCIYFIASSLWGLAERKLLPKTSPSTSTPPQAKPKPKPKPTPQQLAAGSNGKSAKKRKKKSGGKR